MRRPISRRGFTLIELLMVIMIVGMLMALLFPALGIFRERGRQTQCMNNMRQVATAVQEFEGANGSYPGWRNYPFTTQGGPIPTGWIFEVLPTLGRNDVPDFVKASKTEPDYPFLQILVCPSDTSKMTGGAPRTSIVGNAGLIDPSNRDTSVPPDWKSNAIFHDLDPREGTTVGGMSSSFMMKNAGDGLATTLLLAESLDGDLWANCKDELSTGFVIKPPWTPRRYVNQRASGVPSSNHPTGVNVIFAGGNGRFLKEEVDYKVFCALVTPKGATARLPNSTTAPSGSFATFINQQPKLNPDDY